MKYVAAAKNKIVKHSEIKFCRFSRIFEMFAGMSVSGQNFTKFGDV